MKEESICKAMKHQCSDYKYWSEAKAMCVHRCPAEEKWNAIKNKCEDRKGNCRKNYVWSTEVGRCFECKPGSSFSQSKVKCFKIKDCTAPLSWNVEAGKCTNP